MARWMPVLVRLEHLELVTQFLGELEAGRPDEDLAEDLDISSPRPQNAAEPSPRDGRAAPGAGAHGAGAGAGAHHALAEELRSLPSWTQRDLERLADGQFATTRRFALALDVCAEMEETYLPTSQIAERTGMSVTQWRSACRKISRHLARHYPDVPVDKHGHQVWPLHAKSIPEFPGEVSWAITRDMAKLWKQVRS